MVQHISDPVPRPRLANPQVPETVEQIILKAAAKEPAERFQSGEEMAEAMESTLGALTAGKRGLPPACRPLYLTSRAGDPKKGRPGTRSPLETRSRTRPVSSGAKRRSARSSTGC